jgi:hypothetical protein
VTSAAQDSISAYSGTNQTIDNFLADPTEEAHTPHGQRRPGADADVGDATYLSLVAKLKKLEVVRDRLVFRIKDALDAAAFRDRPVRHLDELIVGCLLTLRAAHRLATHS